VPIIIKFESS